MKNFFQTLVWPLMTVPGIYLLISWNRIPETVPMQYNLQGEIVRYGSRKELIFLVLILAAVNLGTYLLLLNVHRIDPKKQATANRGRMKKLAIGISLFISAITMMMVYFASHPELKPQPNLVLVILGFLFAFLGNQMHTIKPNYFAGFRLPWTLENEDNWKQTHALGGKIWFVGGLLIAVLAIFTPFRVAIVAMIALMAVMILVPLIFSYRFYKKHKA
jgi:uncharacterized membrane protein